MSRAPVAAFVTLVIATVAAFFVTQHLKVTTPVIQGRPAPVPNHINPVYGGVCVRRTSKGMLVRTNYKHMQISFYLQNRSDNVTVQIVDRDEQPVRTIGNNVFMRAKPPRRHLFTWDGRLADGSIAPAGTYYVKVSLLHQARSLIISNSTAASPITVETTRPQARVTSVAPATITPGSRTPVTIHYTGTDGVRPRILIYRVTGATQKQVKSFAATTRSGSSTWDGTLHGGRPAPPGTYLVAVRVIDKACTTGTSPMSAAGAPHAVVTVG